MNAPPVQTLFDFTGKVALVTGAGSGLGSGLALRFAQAGAQVIVHYRSSGEMAQALAAQIEGGGGQAHALQADVSVEAEVERLFAQSVEYFGRVDILINNAGSYPLHPLVEMVALDWDAVINANLRSVFLCTQAFARHARQRSGGGAIVNITSIEASNPAPNHSHYSAAKAGVEMFTRSAANELAAFGVRVNAVAPGLIWREGLEAAWPEGVKRWLAAAPLGRLGLPEDVADACLFLASQAARWITGASLLVDGGVMTKQII
jgi:NAD(P)-dependent dehydrogenase (short-subunit alcohol dehydrogenase family)